MQYFYTRKKSEFIFLLLILLLCINFLSYADTEYTQYISGSNIESAGSQPNPSDPDWREGLSHIISSGDGYYWQGSNEDGDCYLQFDLRTRCEVNCFRILFYQAHLRRYRFKISYNTTTNNPGGAYYTARNTDWSVIMSGDAFVSFHLDATINARYFRIYFYGNDGSAIDRSLVRVDEVRIWDLDFRVITPNSYCEWRYNSSYTILYTQFPDSGDPRDRPKRIELHKNNRKLCNIDANVINTGRKSWTVGSDTDPGTTADTNLYSGSNYSIKIVDLYGAGSIESDWFTITGGVTPGPTVTPVNTPSPAPITPPPTPRPTPAKIITVNRPRMGETVTTGFSSSIKWNSENVAGPVRIILKNHWKPGQTWNVVASTPDDGYFDWKVDYQI